MVSEGFRCIVTDFIARGVSAFSFLWHPVSKPFDCRLQQLPLVGKHRFGYWLHYQLAIVHIHQTDHTDVCHGCGMYRVSVLAVWAISACSLRITSFYFRYGLIEYRVWQKQKNLEAMLSD